MYYFSKERRGWVGNSLFAYSPANDAALLVVDNDYESQTQGNSTVLLWHWQGDCSRFGVRALKEIKYNPDLILLGHSNGGTCNVSEKGTSHGFQRKREVFNSAYPHVTTLLFPDSAICQYPSCTGGPSEVACDHGHSHGVVDCDGQRLNVSKPKSKHQCFPGPLARVAEIDAHSIVLALSRHEQAASAHAPGA